MSTCICRTEGCPNDGVRVEMTLTWIDPESGEEQSVDGVACGPCGQPIEDIRPPLGEEQPPMEAQPK